MANYLNPGNERFREELNSEIYVDKTGLIGYTNKFVSTYDRYIRVSRPRGFGKSYAADMLTAYYSRGCDSRALFENLKIAKDPTFEKHLNKYDVLFINMKNFMSAKKTVSEGMELMAKEVSTELKEYAPDVEFTTEEIPFMLNRIYNKTAIPFVIIIDEYDAPFREMPHDEKGQELYLDFLTCLLKDKAYVALAYVTGILPVKQMGESGPSMFDEYTIIDPGHIGECFGFTEDEVRGLSERYGVPFENLRNMYGAYNVGGVPMYNPWSVTKSLMHDKLGSYWTKTAPYEELKGYINVDRDGLHDALVQILVVGSYPVSPEMSAGYPGAQTCLDDILILLVHLGYLTYDSKKCIAKVPNHEIRREFINTMRRMGSSLSLRSF